MILNHDHFGLMIGYDFNFGLALVVFVIFLSQWQSTTVSLILFAFDQFYYGAKLAAWE